MAVVTDIPTIDIRTELLDRHVGAVKGLYRLSTQVPIEKWALVGGLMVVVLAYEHDRLAAELGRNDGNHFSSEATMAWGVAVFVTKVAGDIRRWTEKALRKQHWWSFNQRATGAEPLAEGHSELIGDDSTEPLRTGFRCALRSTIPHNNHI